MPAPAGYSGTPLAKKLGIETGVTVLLKNAPVHYRDLLEPLPPDVKFVARLSDAVDVVHLFVDESAQLADALPKLRRRIRASAAVWISWPKKASGVPTDLTEDAIRALALPLGFVDVKVCAVDATWSALKLVVRKELR